MKATLLSDKLNAAFLIYAYAVLLGAMYLFAFWRPFGFSVFPFMDLGDYISVPLNNVIVLIAFPFLALPMHLQRLELNPPVFKNGMLILIFLYSILAIYYCISDIQLFLTHSFRYPNESNVLWVIGALVAATGAITLLAQASPNETTHFFLLAFALILAQSSAVLGAGYNDGKTYLQRRSTSSLPRHSGGVRKGGKSAVGFVARFSDSSII